MRKHLSISLLFVALVTIIIVPQQVVTAQTLYFDTANTIDINFNIDVAWLNITYPAKFADPSTDTAWMQFEYFASDPNIRFFMAQDIGSSENLKIFNDTVIYPNGIVKISIDMSVSLIQKYYINDVLYRTVYGFQVDTVNNFLRFQTYASNNIWGETVQMDYSEVNPIPQITNTVTVTNTETDTITETNTVNETITQTDIYNVTTTFNQTDIYNLTVIDTIPITTTEIVENNFTSINTVEYTESVTMREEITRSVTEISKVFDVPMASYLPIMGIFTAYQVKKRKIKTNE